MQPRTSSRSTRPSPSLSMPSEHAGAVLADALGVGVGSAVGSGGAVVGVGSAVGAGVAVAVGVNVGAGVGSAVASGGSAVGIGVDGVSPGVAVGPPTGVGCAAGLLSVVLPPRMPVVSLDLTSPGAGDDPPC